MPSKKSSEEKIRKCLSCDREFKSNWNGNRICNHCKKNQAVSQDDILPQRLEISKRRSGAQW